MKDFLTIIIVVFFFVFIFTGISVIGDESITNSNIDDESQQLLVNINYELDTNLSEETFEESESDIAGNNSNFDSEETFSREFLESESSAEKKINVVERIFKIPDLIITGLGVPEDWLAPVKWIITTLIGIFVSFATYRAFFGPGKVSD